MSKISKFFKSPKLFFKDYFEKNFLKKDFNLNSVFKYPNKGIYQIEKFVLYVLILLTPFVFSYYYFVGRNKYLVGTSIVLRKSLNKNNVTPDFNSLFAGLSNQASLNESKYLEVT